MILTEYVETRMGGTNINYYQSLGYAVKLYDFLIVPVEILQCGSKALIEVTCDYCGRLVEKCYRNLLAEREKSITKKDCCSSCIPKKNKESNLLLYGVENAMQREEVRDKLKTSMLELYGVEFITQNKDIALKAKNSRNNVSDEIKENRREKTKKTTYERYGVTSTLLLPSCRNNLFNFRSFESSQQVKIFEIIRDEYGENNTSISFVHSGLCLDILLSIENIKIDIEYDSWYWHEPVRDRRRDEFLKSEGYKILRIKSGKKIPDKNLLFEKINFLISSSYNYGEIILDDWDNEKYMKGRES